jgi:hypothetical protein
VGRHYDNHNFEKRKQNIFLQGGWTGIRKVHLTGKSLARRRCSARLFAMESGFLGQLPTANSESQPI